MTEANRFRFRAWNKYKRKMMRVAVIDFLADEVKVMKPSGEQMRRAWPLCDVTLMQSTGLTDANGVEIFEGDIVERDAWRGTIDSNGDVCTILSDKYKYKQREVVKWYRSIPFIGFRLQTNHVVIGNIYENPELLEAANA